MAVLVVSNVGETAATLYIDELNMTTTYKNIRITCNGYTSPNLAKSAISLTSNAWTPPLLNSGTKYPVTWEIESSGGSTANGSGSFTTVASKVRPSEWSWSSTIQNGLPVNVTSSEWNNFCNRINQFRDYKGLPTLTYSTAYYGLAITTAQYNQARSAIASMGAVPPVVYTGSDINSSAFNSLKEALNAIY